MSTVLHHIFRPRLRVVRPDDEPQKGVLPMLMRSNTTRVIAALLAVGGGGFGVGRLYEQRKQQEHARVLHLLEGEYANHTGREWCLPHEALFAIQIELTAMYDVIERLEAEGEYISDETLEKMQADASAYRREIRRLMGDGASDEQASDDGAIHTHDDTSLNAKLLLGHLAGRPGLVSMVDLKVTLCTIEIFENRLQGHQGKKRRQERQRDTRGLHVSDT
jgi:hypothetical protein